MNQKLHISIIIFRMVIDRIGECSRNGDERGEKLEQGNVAPILRSGLQSQPITVPRDPYDKRNKDSASTRLF